MKRRRVWIGIAIAVVIVLVIAVPLCMHLWGGGFAGRSFRTMRGGLDMHSWRGAGMGHMGMSHMGVRGGGMRHFFGLLLLGGAACLIAKAWRKRGCCGLLGPEDEAEDTSLELLKRRLVNGEISPEEYQSIKETLLS